MYSQNSIATHAAALEAEAAPLIPKWAKQKRRTRIASIYAFVQSRRYDCVGVFEAVAGGLPDRFAFWLQCSKDAGPGNDSKGAFKDLELGFRRLKIRWLRRLFKRASDYYKH